MKRLVFVVIALIGFGFFGFVVSAAEQQCFTKTITTSMTSAETLPLTKVWAHSCFIQTTADNTATFVLYNSKDYALETISTTAGIAGEWHTFSLNYTSPGGFKYKLSDMSSGTAYLEICFAK